MKLESENNIELVLIPPIGGHSWFYKPFANYNSGRINCYSLDYFKLNGNNSIAKLSNNFVRLIEKKGFSKTKKLYILGYSTGVAIAFEMTKQLESLGYICELIFVDRPPNDNHSKVLAEKHLRTALLKIGNGVIDVLDYFFAGKERKHRKKGNKEEEKWIRSRSEILLKDYETVGGVKANITYVEAIKGRKRKHLDLWKKYTEGEFTYCSIDDKHREVLSEKHYKTISSLIK